MTATELAEMLKGWPKGARPRWEYAAGNYCGDKDVLSEQEATNLACMAGLRWRREQPGTREVRLHPTFGGLDPERVTVVSDGLTADSDTVQTFTGPTLLHAIDAAIRGCN